MYFLIFNINNTLTLPESTLFSLVVMLGAFCVLLQCAAPFILRGLRNVCQRRNDAAYMVLKAKQITGLTANEKNSYQRSPERRSSSGHGRWSATLRSGRRSPVTGTEKIQRLQR